MNTSEENKFAIRSYGKGELASLYMPGILPKSALATFNEWINKFPGLPEALQQSGLCPSNRRYTPAQVRLIIKALGEP